MHSRSPSGGNQRATGILVTASGFAAAVLVILSCSAAGSANNHAGGAAHAGSGATGNDASPGGGAGNAGTGAQDDSSSGGTDSDASPDTSSGGAGLTPQDDSSTGGSGGCAKCSADGRDVVDCNGNVLIECPTGQVCYGGSCGTDLCAAAQQNGSNNGCEYWALNLDNILSGACYAVFIANTSPDPVQIQVDYKGAQLPVSQFTKVPQGQGSQITYGAYDSSAGLGAGNVAILFLAQKAGELGPPVGEPCPTGITPALTVDPAVHGTGIGNGFHITATAPVVAYQIFPYGGGNAAITSATLLLPTNVWDVNYIAVNGYAQTQLSNNWGLPSLDILAAQDDTSVTITPVAAIAAGTGVAAAPAGQSANYALSRGQYLQISQAAELTGSTILATKPVAFFAGNSCMNIPVSVDACDTAQQQIPPVRALGSEYAAVRYVGRAGGTNESVPWRLVGAVDGTQLTYTPSAPSGAPSTINSGSLAEFDTADPFIVASQDSSHPFYMSGHMTGGSQFNGEGDPEFVNVVPTGQYMDGYTFFTDPTYPETSLVVIRKQGTSGFADVTLDCAGVIGGWTALGPYQWTRVQMVTGDFQSVNGCQNGRHVISSNAPFAVTVWGWGSTASLPFSSTYVSYAYPGGAGVAPINGVVVAPK